MITPSPTLYITSHCRHCGNDLSALQLASGFCCSGCSAVYQILQEEGMDGYYRLRPSRILPVIDLFRSSSNFNWLENLRGKAEGNLHLAIEGVQCGACVWAITIVEPAHESRKV